jgi:hypothetical protein
MATGIEGIVLDPQGRGVPNAAVTLTCGGVSQFSATDNLGRYRFDSPTRGDCSLDVRRPGFAPAFERLIDRPPGPIAIRLELAPLTAEVRVTGRDANRSPFGLVLAEDDFRHLASSADDLIRLAQARAGVAQRGATIYVDGLPATVMPPIDMIARIAVNTDPFSAEFAHGDMTTIHITTRAPSRRLRFYTGGTGLSLGGKDALASRDERPEVLSGHVGVMGAVPRSPLTFTLSGSGSRNTRVTAVTATLPPDVDPARGGDVTRTNRHIGGGLELNYARGGDARARLTYREDHSDSRNGGAGELSLIETGSFTQGVSRDFRLTANRIVRGHTYELGASAVVGRFDMRANSTGLGISVPGQFVSGGGSLASSESDRGSWTLKQVVRSGSTRPWSAGVIASATSQSSTDEANPRGLIEFDSIDDYVLALGGARTGTLLRSQSTSASYQSLLVSPFAQKTVWRSNDFEINAGVRGDYQRGFGIILSPRLSAAVTWRGYVFAAGAGLFARDIPHPVIWRIERDASVAGTNYIARGVSLTDAPASVSVVGNGLTSRLDPDIERPREWMGRVSVERSIGLVSAGVEYSRARETQMLGSRRDRSGDGWIDTFESNRRSSRNRVNSHVRFERSRQQVSVNYEWTREYDDTDGAWSHAEHPDQLGAEWARSSRTSPHGVTLSGTFWLPGAISLNVTESWYSGAPYNVTTGFDPLGNGLRSDRGGRPRNSAMMPSTNELSAYANRRFALPDRFVPGKRRFFINLGIHGNNLLNDQAAVALGSVLGTPTFGRPTAVQPGRALRVTFSLD